MGDDKKTGVRSRYRSSIEIDFYYRGVRCRERMKLAPTLRNLAFAAKLKGRIEHEIATNVFDYAKHFPDSAKVRLFARLPGDNLTIEAYLESGLATEKDNIRHSTLIGYAKILKYHLVPKFGKLALTELRRKHLRDWTAAHPDISAKRMRNILSPLRIALDAAVERELIESNPCALPQAISNAAHVRP